MAHLLVLADLLSNLGPESPIDLPPPIEYVTGIKRPALLDENPLTQMS
jgi:hypothetical protein